jgi:hypothetical protein
LTLACPVLFAYRSYHGWKGDSVRCSLKCHLLRGLEGLCIISFYCCIYHKLELCILLPIYPSIKYCSLYKW